jgi:hypothetical protein
MVGAEHHLLSRQFSLSPSFEAARPENRFCFNGFEGKPGEEKMSRYLLAAAVLAIAVVGALLLYKPSEKAPETPTPIAAPAVPAEPAAPEPAAAESGSGSPAQAQSNPTTPPQSAVPAAAVPAPVSQAQAPGNKANAKAKPHKAKGAQ